MPWLKDILMEHKTETRKSQGIQVVERECRNKQRIVSSFAFNFHKNLREIRNVVQLRILK